VEVLIPARIGRPCPRQIASQMTRVSGRCLVGPCRDVVAYVASRKLDRDEVLSRRTQRVGICEREGDFSLLR
jgi:hypothetical protein